MLNPDLQRSSLISFVGFLFVILFRRRDSERREREIGEKRKGKGVKTGNREGEREIQRRRRRGRERERGGGETGYRERLIKDRSER